MQGREAEKPDARLARLQKHLKAPVFLSVRPLFRRVPHQTNSCSTLSLKQIGSRRVVGERLEGRGGGGVEKCCVDVCVVMFLFFLFVFCLFLFLFCCDFPCFLLVFYSLSLSLTLPPLSLSLSLPPPCLSLSLSLSLSLTHTHARAHAHTRWPDSVREEDTRSVSGGEIFYSS